MNKPKNTELNFLYMDEKYQNKKNKKNQSSKNGTKTRNMKNNKRADKNKSAQEDNAFNFDEEIIIGVTKVQDDKKENSKKIKNKKSEKKQNKKQKNKGQADKKISTKKIKEVKKRTKVKTQNKKVNNKENSDSKNRKIVKVIVKWIILFSALIASIVFFMMSKLFDIKEIEVINNEKISAETIISLSQIKIGENLFKMRSGEIEKNIKENAYIESVETSRKLPNKIELDIKERKATYMLEYANSFAYINNQGYILEISEEKIEVPIIVGYITKEEEIKPGMRLNNEDLEKLEVVLKIMESANSNQIANLITRINIENKQNYCIILEDEKKIAYIGDASNLSSRMLYLRAVLQEEKGIEGEIFINGDLNKKDVYFRKK